MALRFPVPQRYGDCHCVSRLLLRQGAGFLGVTLGRVVVVREITVTLDGEEFARDVALVLDMLAATEHLADISGGPSLGARPGALMPREPLDLAPRDGARWQGVTCGQPPGSMGRRQAHRAARRPRRGPQRSSGSLAEDAR